MYIANTFKKTTYWVGILVVGFLIGTSLQFAKAVWTEPGAAPPGGNVAGPLNTSTTLQTKNGTLNVNGFRNLGTTVLDGNVGIGTTAAGINNAKGAAGYVTAKDYYISDIGKWASEASSTIIGKVCYNSCADHYETSSDASSYSYCQKKRFDNNQIVCDAQFNEPNGGGTLCGKMATYGTAAIVNGTLVSCSY